MNFPKLTVPETGIEAEIERLSERVIALHDSLRFNEAVPVARLAVSLARTHSGPYGSVLAGTLTNLAGVLTEVGAIPEASALYHEAVDIYHASPVVLPYQIAQAYNGFGVLAEAAGEYSNAVDWYRGAVEILGKHIGRSHPDLAPYLNNLGRGRELIGDFDRAEVALKEALKMREQLAEAIPIARSCSNLAELYCVMRRYPDSRVFYDRALSIHIQQDPTDVDGLAAALNGLGLLEKRTGEYESAIEHLSQALELWSQNRGSDDPNTLSVASNLAVLYGRTGRLDEAERRLRETLARRRSRLGNHHPDVAISLHNLGLNQMAQGRDTEAFSILAEATSIDDAILGQVMATASERQALEYLAHVAERTDAFLTLVSTNFANNSEAVRAAYDVVLHTKAISIEALRAQRALSLSGTAEVDSRRARLQALSAAMAGAAFGDRPSSDPDASKAHIEALEAERDNVERDLARLSPEFDLAAHIASTRAGLIARALQPEALLIEYVRVATPLMNSPSGRYLAFAIGPGHSDVQMFTIGEADQVDSLVDAIRRRVARISNRSRPDATQSKPGKALSDLLFPPLLRTLRDTRQLVISPDGQLIQLPFHALPFGDGLLIDHVEVAYVGCGRDLILGSEASAEPGPSVVIADPDFNLGYRPKRRGNRSKARRSRGWRASTTFERLRGTRREGEKVARMLSVQPLTGRRAVKSAVRLSRRPSVLHLATHGFFFSDQILRGEIVVPLIDSGPMTYLEAGLVENPLLRSGLALAGANAWARRLKLPVDAEDGILTAEDVSMLDLHGTELVVLSACDTGLGAIRFGAGVLGLRRAFAVAGAQTLVMSLWKVPDEHTAKLMTTFYRGLRRGLTSAAALREAQQQVRRKTPHPFYWAAFICEGRVQAMQDVALRGNPRF